MKKLLLTEGLLACFFLALLLGFLGKYLGKERDEREVNARLYEIKRQQKSSIRIYPGQMQDEFSPLCYQTAGEENVLSMCFTNLLQRDRNGKRVNPAVSEWKGEESEPVQISVERDKEKGICVATVSLNPKERTSEGKKMDADDLLFNFYLRCDATSGSSVPFGGVKIFGQEEYTYGDKDLKKRKKELGKALKQPSQELKKLFQEEIVEKELSREFSWVKGLYQDEAYDFVSSKYDEAKDLFAYYYAYQTKYSSREKSESAVFADILKQYGWNYERLSKVTGKSYTEEAKRLALSWLLQQKGKDTVKQIAGLWKVNASTIAIRYTGTEKDVDKLCNLWLLPLEDYGDRKQFDGKECFGFIKGNAGEILKETYQRYRGTGAYYSREVRSGRIVLRRNLNYLGGKAGIAKVSVLRREYERTQDLVEALLQKKVDLAVARDGNELKKLLANRGTRASYAIRKVSIETSQSENCFLYRTDYVNAPSLPKNLTEYQTLFARMNQIKVN